MTKSKFQNFRLVFQQIDDYSKILHGCIRNQGRARSRAWVRIVVGHSFGGRALFYGATPICTVCTVYSFGGGVGIVLLADSRRQMLPSRHVPSLFKFRQGVWRCKKLNGCLYNVYYYIFCKTHTVRMIELKNQANRPRNKKVVRLDICNWVT